MRFQFALGLLLSGIMNIVVCNSANAGYLEADLPSANQADVTVGANSAGAHIVIAGRGLEAGKTWLMAAQTQALVFHERDEARGVKLFTAFDPAKKDEYVALLQNWGYENILIHEDEFTANELILCLHEVALISSFDFIGHDGAFLGLALEDEGANHRFYISDVRRMKGQVRFSKDAFIRLLGCNTGWFLAPAMAVALGVPARGTLTSADVELVYGSGAKSGWFYDEDGGQPPGSARAKHNLITFENAQRCTSGAGCTRLKAINGSYVGQHGVYAGSLPFAKYFCGNVPQEDCFRRMALSVQYSVSVTPMEKSTQDQVSSIDNFAAALADDFCPPSNVTSSWAVGCRENVVNEITGRVAIDRNYTTLKRANTQLICTFSRCAFHVGHDDKGQKILLSDSEQGSTSFVDELDAFRDGYARLAR